MARTAQNMLVKGSTSGTAIPAGYIGEKLSASGTGSTGAISSSSLVDVPNSSITLPVGVWQYFYPLQAIANGVISSPSSVTVVFAGGNIIFDGSTIYSTTIATISGSAFVTSAYGNCASTVMTGVVYVASGTKIIKVAGSRATDGGVTNPTANVSTAATPYAIRIA
jgi:hypothetical protein